MSSCNNFEQAEILLLVPLWWSVQGLFSRCTWSIVWNSLKTDEHSTGDSRLRRARQPDLQLIVSLVENNHVLAVEDESSHHKSQLFS
jgi:hypothetical protein